MYGHHVQMGPGSARGGGRLDGQSAIRPLRWVGFAVALVGMTAGLLNVVVAPWGNGPEGVLPGFQLFGYVGENSFLLRGLDPVSRFYLEGMPGVLLAGAMAGLAVTVGVRARWARWLAAGLAIMVATLFLLAAAGRMVSAGNPLFEAEAEEFRLTAIGLFGFAILIYAAAVALALRAHVVYEAFAVVAGLLLGPFHLWSVYQLSSEPESGLRLLVLAWTPAGWFLLGALGALLAMIGAGARPAPAVPDAGGRRGHRHMAAGTA